MKDISAKKRKKQIKKYRDQEEKKLEKMTDEEMTEYLLNVFKKNDEIIKKYDLPTISEEDIEEYKKP